VLGSDLSLTGAEGYPYIASTLDLSFPSPAGVVVAFRMAVAACLSNLHGRTCTHSLQHLDFLFSFKFQLRTCSKRRYNLEGSKQWQWRITQKMSIRARSPGLYTRNKRLKFKYLDRHFHHKIYIKTKSTSLIEK
jgi:hypothetical protein